MVDFNGFQNLIHNLGLSAARIENNKFDIDSKSEVSAFIAGAEECKTKELNKEQGVIEVGSEAELDQIMKKELASLMGADFGTTKAGLKQHVDENGKAKFSEEDLSLENLMSLLEPEEGLNIDQVREYSKKPMLSSASEINPLEELEKLGMNEADAQVLMNTVPGAMKFITDAIKDGSAKRITNYMTELGYGNEAIGGFMTNPETKALIWES
ncbi:hypothetical protein J6O48_04140 [bacterium]|nr:hypothetical protein [bacterium]